MEIIAIAYVRDKKETVKLRKLNQVEKQKAHSEEQKFSPNSNTYSK